MGCGLYGQLFAMLDEGQRKEKFHVGQAEKRGIRGSHWRRLKPKEALAQQHGGRTENSKFLCEWILCTFTKRLLSRREKTTELQGDS